MAQEPLSNTSSLSDLLSAVKNIVLALSNASLNFLNVQGAVCASGLTVPTIVKTSAGRVCRVSIINPGAGLGKIYDATSLTDTTKPIYVIQNIVTADTYEINMPVSFGIVVVPGTGQVVTVSYS